MAVPIIVQNPWIHISEWIQVFHGLYSKDWTEQEAAISTYFVWKSRGGTKMSLGIETTVCLVKALRKHETTDDPYEQMDACMMYTTALTRFINLVTEIKQDRSIKKPIREIARKLGIHESIVDMRHEASHNRLPAIHSLKKAAKDALLWLKHKYWQVELINMTKNPISPKQSHSSNKEVIMELNLQKYMQQRFETVQQKLLKKNNFPDPSEDVMSELKRCYALNRQLFLVVICENGYLTPSQEQLEQLLNNEDLDSSVMLHPKVIQFWKPIILFIDERNGLTFLIKKIVSHLTDQNTLRDRQLLGWLQQLLKGPKGQALTHYPNLIGEIVFEVFLKSKCYAAVCLLPRTVRYFTQTVNKKKRRKLQTIINLLHIPNDGITAKPNGIKRKYDEFEVNTLKRWRTIEDDSWYSVPVGAIIGSSTLKLPANLGPEQAIIEQGPQLLKDNAIKIL